MFSASISQDGPSVVDASQRCILHEQIQFRRRAIPVPPHIRASQRTKVPEKPSPIVGAICSCNTNVSNLSSPSKISNTSASDNGAAKSIEGKAKCKKHEHTESQPRSASASDKIEERSRSPRKIPTSKVVRPAMST